MNATVVLEVTYLMKQDCEISPAVDLDALTGPFSSLSLKKQQNGERLSARLPLDSKCMTESITAYPDPHHTSDLVSRSQRSFVYPYPSVFDLAGGNSDHGRGKLGPKPRPRQTLDLLGKGETQTMV